MARPEKSPPRRSDAPPRVPDRSLTPEEPLPTMAIRAAGTHQFVYRKMVEGPVGAAAPNHGDLVRVVDRDGVAPRLRPLERTVADQPAVPVAAEKCRQGPSSGAVASTRRSRLRTTVLGLDRETNAYRVVHAEGDGLSGLIVDRYDDVLSVEVFSLGMYQRIGPILSLLRRVGWGRPIFAWTSTSGSRCRKTFRAGRWPARSFRPA